jgi:hypothetical protein
LERTVLRPSAVYVWEEMLTSYSENPDERAILEDQEPVDLSEIMDFSAYNLKTTIRLIILSGESRRIDITKGTLQGAIFIEAGEIYRVEANESSGDEALFAILSWQNPLHTDSQIKKRLESNVKIPTPVFLDILKC